jgi:hypothetical protein
MDFSSLRWPKVLLDKIVEPFGDGNSEIAQELPSMQQYLHYREGLFKKESYLEGTIEVHTEPFGVG